MCNMECKSLGVGINYRKEIGQALADNLHHFDFVEINTERLFQPDLSPELLYIIEHVPIVLHGLTLSIGTLNQEIPATYLAHLQQTLERFDCPWFSEHLAVTAVGEVEIRALMPAEFNLATVNQVVNKVKTIMQVSRRPFLLENITYYYPMPNSTMTELEFINEIVSQTGCHLLLDLTNLYANSINHGYDAYEFIDQLPLDKLIEVHLAGCDKMHGMMIDTHASTVKNEVLDLFEYVCKKATISGVIIERDDRLHDFKEMITEAQLIRSLLQGKKSHVIN